VTTAAGDYLLSISLECQTGSGPVITTASLPNGKTRHAYSRTLATANAVAPATFARVSGSLPAGLTLSSGGRISGTPRAVGLFSFAARLTDARGLRFTRALTLRITDGTPPTVSRLRASHRSFAPIGAAGPAPNGTTFRFTLSEAAKVRVAFAKIVGARKVGKGFIRFNGRRGRNAKAFSGRLRGHALVAGSYDVTLTATDAAGNRSRKYHLRITIVSH
jgi:hypothetical protein